MSSNDRVVQILLWDIELRLLAGHVEVSVPYVDAPAETAAPGNASDDRAGGDAHHQVIRVEPIPAQVMVCAPDVTVEDFVVNWIQGPGALAIRNHLLGLLLSLPFELWVAKRAPSLEASGPSLPS